MPPAAFRDLWDNLKAGKCCLGIVKNRCENGDFYGIDVFITPSREVDRVTGNESVRVVPEPDCVEPAEQLYRRLWSARKRLSLPQPGLREQLTLGFAGLSALPKP